MAEDLERRRQAQEEEQRRDAELQKRSREAERADRDIQKALLGDDDERDRKDNADDE